MHEQGSTHTLLVESELQSDDEHEHLTTEQQVEEALQHLPSASDISVELRPCEKTEELLVDQFVREGCGCSRKCSAQFSINHIRDVRDECYRYQLSRDELDTVLLGQLMASPQQHCSGVPPPAERKTEKVHHFPPCRHACVWQDFAHNWLEEAVQSDKV